MPPLATQLRSATRRFGRSCAHEGRCRHEEGVRTDIAQDDGVEVTEGTSVAGKSTAATWLGWNSTRCPADFERRAEACDPLAVVGGEEGVEPFCVNREDLPRLTCDKDPGHGLAQPALPGLAAMSSGKRLP